ncbi:cyclic dehypoxanthinyl futalosine synthase [Desulfocurvibacter africanus]|uniref:cyclic dehypoxanthinyl futalosine synthase n=1 Tax=Desulfocurvibacter africanus TaxID=873 RepID=UPI00041898A7|nr:cyclic dehypoxanthinyl futalosine synthase [Desulfocurvibacter africanus]
MRQLAETSDILSRAVDGGRLDKTEALRLWREAPQHDLAHAAHALRLRKAPADIVTYVVDRNINYTNVCVCGCKFCAYFRAPGQPEGFVLPFEELGRKIDETLALGGTQILLQGGHHPNLPLSWYEDMLRFIKGNHPIHVHAFSPPEIVHFAGLSGLSTAEVIARLKRAGLDSIPGGGAEILVDRVRREASPNKCPAGQWLAVMEEAHNQGLRTSATMMFGHLETDEERIEHLLALRDAQDRTGGFTAFIPWTFQPDNTALAATVREKQAAPVYLRFLALSRLVLDNFANLQVSWVTMGPKIAQLALFHGANDFGSTMIEENVVAAAGVSFLMGEDEIRKLIEDAGFAPRRRRMDYSQAPEPSARATEVA